VLTPPPSFLFLLFFFEGVGGGSHVAPLAPPTRNPLLLPFFFRAKSRRPVFFFFSPAEATGPSTSLPGVFFSRVVGMDLEDCGRLPPFSMWHDVEAGRGGFSIFSRRGVFSLLHSNRTIEDAEWRSPLSFLPASPGEPRADRRPALDR